MLLIYIVFTVIVDVVVIVWSHCRAVLQGLYVGNWGLYCKCFSLNHFDLQCLLLVSNLIVIIVEVWLISIVCFLVWCSLDVLHHSFWSDWFSLRCVIRAVVRSDCLRFGSYIKRERGVLA